MQSTRAIISGQAPYGLLGGLGRSKSARGDAAPLAQGRHRDRPGRREAHGRVGGPTVVLDGRDVVHLLTDLQDRTQLTRPTLYRIVTGGTRLDDFVHNPQQFIGFGAGATNRCSV